MIKANAPHIEGLNDPTLQQNNSWPVPSAEFIQIINANNNHWITISNIGCDKISTVNVYDSLQQLPTESTCSTIAKYVQCPEDNMMLNIMNVDRQTDGSSCGVYATAFAASLAAGEDPVDLKYNNPTMRAHLAQCVTRNQLTPFPSVAAVRRRRVMKSKMVNLHCVCRQPDTGSFMICCDSCNQWYHGCCVGLKSKPPNGKWYCNKCN